MSRPSQVLKLNDSEAYRKEVGRLNALRARLADREAELTSIMESLSHKEASFSAVEILRNDPAAEIDFSNDVRSERVKRVECLKREITTLRRAIEKEPGDMEMAKRLAIGELAPLIRPEIQQLVDQVVETLIPHIAAARDLNKAVNRLNNEGVVGGDLCNVIWAHCGLMPPDAQGSRFWWWLRALVRQGFMTQKRADEVVSEVLALEAE